MTEIAPELVPRIRFGSLDLTNYPYSVVMDYDLGAGGLAYEALVSRLLDGELVTANRVSNRELKFTVLVEGATLREVAANTAALSMECDQESNTLTIEPGDTMGAATTAFDTYRALLEPQHRDAYEMATLRSFDLTIPAAPFARSVDLTTQAAVPMSPLPVVTVVDSGTALTNWQALYGGVASVVAGAVRVTQSNPVTYYRNAMLRYLAPLSLTNQNYLVVDWTASRPGTFWVMGAGKAGSLVEAYRETSPITTGWIRSWFYCGDAATKAAIATELRFQTPEPIFAVGDTMDITQLATADRLPDSSTAGHQQNLTISSGGSARTQAAVEVVHATATLGEVVLYTSPADKAYNPSARRHLKSSGPAVVDPAGNYYPLPAEASGVQIPTYDIPASTVPKGGYMIAARMRCTTTVDVTVQWSNAVALGGTEFGNYQSGTTVVSFVANKWVTVPLGLATLPNSPVGPAGFVRLVFSLAIGTTATVHIYDAFIFHESGDLTIMDCGLGVSAPAGPSRRMRVLPPSAEYPGGAAEVAHSADWSDSFGAGSLTSVRPPRGHVLHPQGTSAFLFTAGTPNDSPASLSASWHKRWHTHAVES